MCLSDFEHYASMLPMCDVFRALTTDSAPAGDKHLLAGLHANLNVNKAFQSLAAAQEDHGTIVHFVYDLLIAFEYLFEPRLRYDEKARMQYITFRTTIFRDLMIGSRLHPEGLTVRERTSKKKLLYFDPWSGLGRRELLLFLRDWAFGKLGGASLNDEPIQPYYTTIDLNFIQSLPTIDIFAWMTKHSTPELDRSLLQSSTVTKGIVVQDGLHLLKTAREHRRTPLDGLCMLMHAFGPLFGAEMSEDPEHKLRITFLSRPFQQLAITSQNDIRMLDLTDLGSCERLLTFNGFSSSGRRELLIFLQQYYLHHDHLGNDARAPTEYSSTDLEAAPRSIGNSAIVGPILAPSKHPSAAETITSRALRNTSGNKSRYHSYSRSKTPSHTHLSKVSAAQDVENSGNDIKTAHEAEMGTSSCDVAEQEILSASTAVSTAERSSDETTGEASHNIKNVVDTVALAWS